MFVSVAAISGIAIRWRQTTGSALPKDLPVFVIGDSLSAGLGPSPAGTWPHLLSQRLGLSVSNLSQAGATLSNSVQHVRSVPAERAIVIVELGGNDILGGTSPEQFASDLRTLLGALTTGDRRVVMFELPLLPFQNSYGRIQRRLCARYGVDLIPRRVLAEAITRRGNSADGLHLAPQGHSWLAERIAHSWSNSFRNVSIR